MAVYQHMINHPLYLPNNSIRNLIQFQCFLEDKAIGPEMECMCADGDIIPQLWMKNAVGSEISVKPMLKAVDMALKMVK